jgi:hypothetical protein
VKAPAACAAPVIDPDLLQQQGGHAVWLSQAGLRIQSVREGQGERPWVAALPDGDDDDD